jgi:hypothetical protein
LTQFNCFILNVFCSTTVCPDIGIPDDYSCEMILMVSSITLAGDAEEAEVSQ